MSGNTLGPSSAQNNALLNFHLRFQSIDPRLIVLGILLIYLTLGFTVLGFNRSPLQALVTSVSACILEVFLARVFKKKWIFPLSALITSCSLSLLINYSHNYWVLFIPVYFAIGSKYLFTFNGRHNFNPAQIAVTLSLLLSGELITAAPAYQWNGIESMGAFIVMFGVFFLLPRINRHWLVLSFLFFFTFNTFLRAMIMKHHLPFETLFLGTLTSPAFFLFTFFMITDPATSPKTKKGQIFAGFAIAVVDLIFHLKQSYFTFFYAASTIQLSILIFRHTNAILKSKDTLSFIFEKIFQSGFYKQAGFILLLAFGGKYSYATFIKPNIDLSFIDFKFVQLENKEVGIDPKMGNTLTRVDPRIQHMAKWLISVGDSTAAGDINNDGLMDLYYSFPLKSDQDRNSLYLNLGVVDGQVKFQKVDLPIINQSKEIEKFGLPSSGNFIDFDNDGDKDLFITYAFGHSYLLKNEFIEKQKIQFVDITKEVGLDGYTNSIAANFIDFNKDGRLDLVLANVWPENLIEYPKDNPQRLNLFKLPKPEFEGDERMFNFMHASWHQATNGGKNYIFIQKENGRFEKLDSEKLNLKETKWTLAIGTADFNNDGWTDLYMANDFGSDDLYYNREGKYFDNIKGDIFGSIGMDTYKGMNATVADFDNNGLNDIYISNVHHAYQAEGSLLWMFNKNEKGDIEPVEKATLYGALNESRFGWGAAAGDLNLDGHTDLIQANGMVDDSIDKKWDECPDYWYVNEKIARSAPSFHRYTNKWGDIRGFCIYGKEQNRVYLNRGDKEFNKFVDIADIVGVTDKTNSRGIALIDFDNNGLLDLSITHMFKAPTIYMNKLLKKSNKSWLGINLESTNSSCNRDAIGSRVEISYSQAGKRVTQMKEMMATNGFNAQSDNRILFGLNGHKGEIDLKIHWCLNEWRSYKVQNLNRYMKITYE